LVLKRQELEKLILEELLKEQDRNYLARAKSFLSKFRTQAAPDPGPSIGRDERPAGVGQRRGIEGYIDLARIAAAKLKEQGDIESPGGQKLFQYMEEAVKELEEAIEIRDEANKHKDAMSRAALSGEQQKYQEESLKYGDLIAKATELMDSVIGSPEWAMVLAVIGSDTSKEEPTEEEPEELELDEKIVGWEAVTDSVKKYLGAEYDEAKVRIVLQALKRVNKNPKIKFERGPMGEPVKEDMELGDAHKMISSEAGISQDFMRAVVLAVINTSNIEVGDFKMKGTPLSRSSMKRKKKEKPESKTHPKGSVTQIGPPETDTFKPLAPEHEFVLDSSLLEAARVWEEASNPYQDPNIYRLERMMDSFYPYAKEQLGFDKDAVVIFESDPENAQLSLAKTGYYDPQTYTVTVYITDRHPKDIMRSVAHELTHHAQNCRGESLKSSGAGEQGYAQNDPNLRAMEDEAYKESGQPKGLLFRDWEDGVKAQFMEAVRQKIKDKTLIKEGKPAIRRLIKEHSSILDVIKR
jgi:hypothetical protein